MQVLQRDIYSNVLGQVECHVEPLSPTVAPAYACIVTSNTEDTCMGDDGDTNCSASKETEVKVPSS